jgi:hypothetical protein
MYLTALGFPVAGAPGTVSCRTVPGEQRVSHWTDSDATAVRLLSEIDCPAAEEPAGETRMSTGSYATRANIQQ